jgi:hypothetical protein
MGAGNGRAPGGVTSHVIGADFRRAQGGGGSVELARGASGVLATFARSLSSFQNRLNTPSQRSRGADLAHP